MINISVGTDIVDINRFNEFSKDKTISFIKKNFSNTEIDYCFSKDNPAPHMAVKFAGKESVIKAFYSCGLKCLPFKKIQILNDTDGVPFVKVDSKEHEKLNIKISLSHCDDKAIAFVIIYGDDRYDE